MGCVPNKKLPVHPTTPSLKTSKVRFQQPKAPPPPSFAPDVIQDQGLNSSQVGSNFLTASRIAGYDLEQQTKQNTYLNSLPMNQKLRGSTTSVTSTLPPSSMIPPLPPLSSQNINLQQQQQIQQPLTQHNHPRMPTPYPQPPQIEQQVSFGNHNYQFSSQDQVIQPPPPKQEVIPVPQFPTSPNIPMIDQTTLQAAQMQQLPQFGQQQNQNQKMVQFSQQNQINRQASMSPQRQASQIPHFPQSYQPTPQPPQIPTISTQPPMIPRPPSISPLIQMSQTPQIPQPPKSPTYSQSPSRPLQPTAPQFSQIPSFQVPPRPTSSTTSIQLSSQAQINQPQQQQMLRPMSPNIVMTRQGMIPVNEDLLRQIMRETHINDQGFKEIFVERMDFGRVK